MRFHSQLLDDLKPLDSRGEGTRVWVSQDRLGGHEVVRKRFEFETPQAPEEWRRHLHLTRALVHSGFVAAEDAIPAGEMQCDVTWRHVSTCGIETVVGKGGPAAFIDILRQISQSMEYCHALGFLHGDLKADNILIEEGAGRFATAITDLEFHLKLGTKLVNRVQGTIGHIPPEMNAGEPLTEASDVFSFGHTIESYLSILADLSVPPRVAQLIAGCTHRDAAHRPPNFQVVSTELATIAKAMGTYRRLESLPPLHPDAFRVRVERVRRAILSEDLTHVGLHLLYAPDGGGKSRVLRTVCIALQIEGIRTLRATGIDSYAELTKRLDGAVGAYRSDDRSRSRPPVVFVEVARECRPHPSELRVLDQLARDLSMTIVAECRSPVPRALPAFIDQIPIPPLRTRECVAATSHLALTPAIAPQNGRSLRAATGGNPRLMEFYMRRDRRVNRGRRLPIPIDADALDDAIENYWQKSLEGLPGPARQVLEWASVFHYTVADGLLRAVVPADEDLTRPLEMLVHHGWLVRLGNAPEPAYALGCRSLRNAIRTTIDASRLRVLSRQILTAHAERSADVHMRPIDHWGLECIAAGITTQAHVEAIRGQSGNLHDLKLVLWTMLSAYRQHRRNRSKPLAWLAVDIADGFSALRSTHRERHWARLAIDGLQREAQAGRQGIDILRATSRMYDTAGETEERTRWLRRTSESATDVLERAFVLSELSAVNILAYRLEDAASRAYEAHHLLEQAALADGSEIYVRNLNRIGLALTLSGQYESAQRYLNQCLTQARQHGFDYIAWRCVGNLGYVHRALGNVREAYRCARGVSNYYRHAGELMWYVNGLRDQVLGLVESGRTNRALQVARLTVDRAMLTGDRSQRAWALNNLGWVLSMRGAAEEAFRTLTDVIAIFRRHANAVPAANSLVNLAWLYLIAQKSEYVRQICREALVLAQSADAGARAVQLEAYRVLAFADILDDAFDDAARHVDEAIRLAAAEGSPKRQAEAALVELELTLWRGDERTARRLIDRLATNPVVSSVHPLWLDFERCKGHGQMMRGDLKEAHATLSGAALAARQAERYDKHIESLMMLSRLSKQMRNYHMATRFADIARGMINRVRKVLDVSKD